MNNASITKEIDWFCLHLVSEKILTTQQCVAIMEALEAQKVEITIEIFKNVILYNKMFGDETKLDMLADMAENEARFAGFPKNSVFDNLNEQQTQQTQQAQQTATAAGAQHRPPAAYMKYRNRTTSPAAAAPQPRNDSVPGMTASRPSFAAKPSAVTNAARPSLKSVVAAGPHWLDGWPHLNDAAGKSPAEAIRYLNDFLHKAREFGCSDVHLSAGALPFVRKYKLIYHLTDQGVLTPEAAEILNVSPLNDVHKKQYLEHHDLDYSYNIADDDRYRANLMHQRFGTSGSYRIINKTITPIKDLGFALPSVIEKLTTYGQGLILVTGPAGSGKSTTMSALVEHINQHRHDHIITVEDPIEMVYHPKGCNINQRELNRHTKSFSNALRAALREDPDVIVIGELRDLETIEMAIHSSETGHLVIGTLHTSSAADTMNRILDVFPHGQQAQIRAMVAESLKGVICQQLLPNKNKDGVVLAYEIMLGTLAISNLIREGKTFQIESQLQTCKNLGMCSMEQSHYDLYMAGKRSYEQTLPFIHTPTLKQQMQMNEAQSLPAATVPGGAVPGAAPRTMTSSRPAPAPEPPKKRRWFGLG